MDIKIQQKDWLFLLVCLGLGILAELSFFHGSIGVSYLVFIAGLYAVVFLRFRLTFTHRRIGLLVMVAIWLLAASYLLYDNFLFYNLNIFIIPVLVFFHIVLITSPNNLRWSTPVFVTLLTNKLGEGIKYSSFFCNKGFRRVFKNMNEQTAQTVKRILIGVIIGLPLLLLITGLLMSADAVFQDIVLRFPRYIVQFNFLEGAFRFVIVMVLTFVFFGVFQVLRGRPNPKASDYDTEEWNVRWNSITAITILVLLNSVYVLFAVIQFKYFFSNGLQEGLTFAEYARRGFFELIIVTLINWTILISCLKLIDEKRKSLKITIKIMYSLLIGVSCVMLASAYQRLSMYEAAYGFTLDRILAHAFMVFLIVIFAYTLIKVWVERLSLLHFYLIVGLLFYTGLNVIHIEKIIVDNNLERYERTEKIDIHYLNSLSYTGVNGLIKLYEKIPEYPQLENVLANRIEWSERRSEGSWQSFNFTKQEVLQKLQELELKEESR